MLLLGDAASVTVAGSAVVAGAADSIVLAGKNSTVTLMGDAMTDGTIEGTSTANGNVLHFKLTDVTTTQADAFKAYVNAHPHAGSFVITRNGQNATYTWADFAQVTDVE